jgi:hypothetical protein
MAYAAGHRAAATPLFPTIRAVPVQALGRSALVLVLSTRSRLALV